MKKYLFFLAGVFLVNSFCFAKRIPHREGLRAGDIPEDTILYLKMDDDSGSKTVWDSSREGNNGTAQQNTSVLSTNGKINTALSFNGTGDYITSTNSGWLNTSITLAVWAKKTSNPSGYTQLVGDAGAGGALYVSSAGEVFFQLKFDGAGNTSSGLINMDEDWTHYVGTWTNRETLKIYKNGVLTSQTALSYTDTITDFTGFQIAKYGAVYFNSIIDDVRIYDRALTQNGIEQLYRVGNWRLP